MYETHRQPRVFFEWPGLIDEETSNVIEDFWVADETLDTASQLLCNPEPNVTQMMMMCNPVRDHPGGTGWHRDVHPVDMAPMDALAADLTENGPRYTQWNVPLYDDNVLWVVPGSHRRRNTEGENSELHANPKSPVSTGVAVELSAGDAVVYSNFLIHTGSNYTTRTRRTLHGGHAIYGAYPDLGFTESLSAEARGKFESFAARSLKHAGCHRGDAESGHRPRRRRIPGRCRDAAAGRRTERQDGAGHLSVESRAARPRAPGPGIRGHPGHARPGLRGHHPITLNWGAAFAERFSVEESRTLWSRFEGSRRVASGRRGDV